ncbi:mannonate dehydratase [Candidatus Enterococcus palustris]|nr:mannonate dehydratase [Enterococcus sp. 7F3_DIV0205]
MKWGFRWYGTEGDAIPLKHIRQIPGITGIVGTLLNKLPGDIWSVEEIQTLKQSVEKEGLELLGIESIAIHDAIKAGTPERDLYIDHYIQTLRNLGKCGISLVCYSFKPIFGWAKTDLAYENEDGSLSLLFDQAVVENMQPEDMYQLIHSQSKGFRLPGWEEERLQQFQELKAMYEGVTEEKLVENLRYFLERVIPVCEDEDIKMGIHPDDPPWEIFGLPRITKNLADLKRILSLVDSPANGITFCTGSLGADPTNDLPTMIREIGDRINFVHFRNVKYLGDHRFEETAHPSVAGSLDMSALMQALVDVGYEGVIRPDHGRAIWDENAMPGYGLYDRAMGLTYIQGLYEATKANENRK